MSSPALDITDDHRVADAAFATLLRSELFQGIEALSIYGAFGADTLRTLSDPTILPRLDRVGVAGGLADGFRDAMSSPIATRITTFAITTRLILTPPFGSISSDILANVSNWTYGVDPGPEVLDLSGIEFTLEDGENAPTLIPQAWAEVVTEWKIPSRIKTLRFGRWYTKALRRAAARKGLKATR